MRFNYKMIYGWKTLDGSYNIEADTLVVNETSDLKGVSLFEQDIKMEKMSIMKSITISASKIIENYTFNLPPIQGTALQILATDGIGNSFWATPTSIGIGTVTSVTGSGLIVSSGGTTPVISLTTGSVTGQILTFNGTTSVWQAPAYVGTVTSVTATSPLASSGGTAPNISISAYVGSGSVVLATSPIISTSLEVTGLITTNGIQRTLGNLSIEALAPTGEVNISSYKTTLVSEDSTEIISTAGPLKLSTDSLFYGSITLDSSAEIFIQSTLAASLSSDVATSIFGGTAVNITAGTGALALSSGAGAITLTAGVGGCTISTGLGSCFITTGAGGISLTVGTGAMTLTTGTGGCTISTGAGALALTTTAGSMNLTVGTGAMSLTTGAGGCTIFTGAGALVLVTGSGSLDLSVGTGAMTLTTGVGGCSIFTGAGALELTTVAGAMNLSVGTGAMTLSTGLGGCAISTGAGALALTTAAGAMALTTGIGGCTISTAAGALALTTAAGAMTLTTGIGGCTVTTGTGALALTTGAGLMTLTTGAGLMALTTGAGAMTLSCGLGLMQLLTVAGGINLNAIGGAITIATTLGGVKVTCASGDSELSSSIGACYIYAPVGGINVGDSGHQNGHFQVYCTNGITGAGTANIELYTSTSGLNTGPGNFSVDTTAAYTGNVTLSSKGVIFLNSHGGIKLESDGSNFITLDTSSTTGSYNWKYPSTAGTAGQVLTSQGTSTMTWSSPASGTITSVTASAPLASSGGSTPNISAISTQGTGSIVLATSPTLTTPNINSVTLTAQATQVIGFTGGNLRPAFMGCTYTGASFGSILSMGVNLLGSTGGAIYNTAQQGGKYFVETDNLLHGWTGKPAGTDTETTIMTLTSTGTLNLSGLTASYSVHTDSSKNLVSIQNNGTGLNILQTSPTLITPTLGVAIGTSLLLSALTASSLVVSDSSKNLVSLSGTANQVLTWVSGIPTWQAPATSGTVTAVTASAPLVSSGGTTPNISVTTTGTGTTVVLASSPILITPTLGVATGTSLAISGLLSSATLNTTGGNGWSYLGGNTTSAPTNTLGVGFVWNQSGVNGESVITYYTGSGSSPALIIKSWNGTIQTTAMTTTTTATTFPGILNVTGVFNGSTLNSSTLTASSLVVSDSSKNLVSLSGTANQVLTWVSGIPTWQAPATGGTVTAVTASAPLVSSGGTTPNISVTTTGTGTTVVLASSPILITPTLGVASGTSLNLSGLTASYSVHTDSSKNLVSIQNNGTGLNILQTSPTLITPELGLATGTSLTFSGTSNFVTRTISSNANFGIIFTSSSKVLGSFLFSNDNASVGYIGINVAGATLAVTGNITATAINLSGLTASYSVHTDSSKNLVSIQNNGTGLNILQTSPTLITPAIGVATGTSLAISGLLSSATLNTTGGNGWSYLGGNTTSTPTNGLGVGFVWNNSGTQGESRMTYYTGAGSSPRLDINSWDGTTQLNAVIITVANTTIQGTLTLGSKAVSIVPTAAGSFYSTTGGTSVVSGAGYTTIGNWSGVLGIGPYDLSYNSGNGRFVNSTGRSVIVTVSYSDQVTGLTGSVDARILKNGTTNLGIQTVAVNDHFSVTSTALLAANDYYEVQISATTGAGAYTTISGATIANTLSQI